MLNTITTKCINGNAAQRFCVNIKCHYASPICVVQRCVCRENHEQCMFTLEIGPFIKKFVLKEQDTYDIEDPIQSYYGMMLKYLDRDLKQYKQIKKEPYSQLSMEERRLFKFLNEGPEASITPQLVLSVSNRLTAEPRLTINYKLKAEVEAVKRETQKCISEIKSKWGQRKVTSNYQQVKHQQEEIINQIAFEETVQKSKPIEVVEIMNYRFDSNLCASGVFSSYFQMAPSGKKIKRSQQFNQAGYFALMAPSLEVNEGNKRVQFKILKIPQKSGMSIGAIYGGTASANHYKLKIDKGGGAYLLGSNGKTYNHYYDKENRINTGFKYATGDTVYMEFDSKNCKLIFYKDPKDTKKVILSFIKDGRNFLHPCVLMWDKFSQVQVM